MGRHRKPRSRAFVITTAAALVPLAAAGTLLGGTAQASETPGNAALDWEQTHAAGCWYAWGGTSCAQGYDCSGVVEQAFLHATGIYLGRSTYDMLRNPHLRRIPVADAQRGDLLFYGSGHVEMKTRWYHVSYGAHDTGTRVGYAHWSGYWAPTMAFRVVR
jgi:cell wall-associated NlpC family hydrolase